MTTLARGIMRTRSAASGLLRWWVAELQDMLPAWLRRRLRRQRPAVIFYPDDDAIEALLAADDALTVLGRWRSDGTEREAAAQWATRQLRQVRRRGLTVGARIPAAAVLRRQVNLPEAVMEDVRGAVMYEIDRLTPYRADDVLFDVRVAGHDRAAAICAIEIIAVPRSSLAGVLDMTSRLGIAPDFVDAPVDPRHPRVSGDIRGHSAAASTPHRYTVARALLLLAFFLATATVVLPIMRYASDSERAAVAVEAGRAKAAYAARLRTELRDLRAAHAVLDNVRRGTPDLITILETLTTLLPDDTFLIEVELSNGRLQIGGYGRSATNVLTAIEASPLFENSTFRVPVTQASQYDREHFQIVTGIAGVRQP